MTNRYEQIIGGLPTGKWYEAHGRIIPARDTPYDFLFQTKTASREFLFFVNEANVGRYTSDSAGNVVISVQLVQGRNDLRLFDTVSGANFRAYLDVRHLATLAAALAEVIEGVPPTGQPEQATGDQAILELRRAPILLASDPSQLEHAGPVYLEEHHGALLHRPNSVGYGTESYRMVLAWLRQGYRLFGGAPLGLRNGVSAFTDCAPLVVSKAWRPYWRLGANLLPTDLLTRARPSTAEWQAAGVDFPNINKLSLTAVVTSFLASAANTYAGAVVQPPHAQPLTVTFSGAYNGGNLTVVGLDPHGVTLSETFTQAAGTTVVGLIAFASITSITKAGGGAVGSLTVGLSDSRFARFRSANGLAVIGANTLTYTNVKTLQLASGVAQTILASGSYTLPDTPRRAELYGLRVENWDLTDSAGNPAYDRFYFEFDGYGLLVAKIVPAGLWTAVTADDVKNAINTALTAAIGTTQYPGTYATLASSVTGTGYTGKVVKLRGPAAAVGSSKWLALYGLPACAGPLVFGLPRTQSTLSAGAAATATTLLIVVADAERFPVPSVERPYNIRVGRGLRVRGTGYSIAGTGTSSTTTVTLTAHTTTPTDLGGAVRLGGGSANVTGTGFLVHRIVQVVAPDSYVIRQEAGLAFPAAETVVGGAWQVFNPGELVTVTNRVTNTLTLAAPGLASARTTGNLVEMAHESPSRVRGLDGLGSVTLDVDVTYAPPDASLSDTLTLAGSVLADGWTINNATAALGEPGHLVPQRLFLTSTGASLVSMQRAVPPASITAIRGLQIRISAWVQQHIAITSSAWQLDVDWGLGAGFDSGAATTTGTTAGSVRDNAAASGSLDPRLVTRVVEVPWNALGLTFRLQHDWAAPGAGQVISIEKVTITTVTSTGLFLGSNTVPRSDHRGTFGELVYVWSPITLSAAELDALGVPVQATPQPSTVTAKTGVIDTIVNAHGYFERVDVSEYVSGNARNVGGAHFDSDLTAMTRVNLELVPGVPTKTSYLRPTRTSTVTQEPLVVSAPSNATLALTSDQAGATIPSATARLYEVLTQPRDLVQPNGTHVILDVGTIVPVPSSGDIIDDSSRDSPLSTVARGPATNQVTLTGGTFGGTAVGDVFRLESGALKGSEARLTVTHATQPTLDTVLPTYSGEAWSITRLPWFFTADNAIKIDAGTYVSTSSYRLDYQALIQATTTVINLGASFADYLWLVDAAIYRRFEPSSGRAQETQQLVFTGGFLAALSLPSDRDQTQATVWMDDGVTKSAVNPADWSFDDAATVRLNGAVFNPDAIFSIDYNGLSPLPTAPVDVTIEVRSAAAANDVATATYTKVDVNAPVDRTMRYHQLRVTFRGIVDVRDVRLYSLGLKGVHLYGASPSAPGLI